MSIVHIESIQHFIDELEKAGELKRVKTEVDTNLEIAEILRRVSYTDGPAAVSYTHLTLPTILRV